MTDVAHAHEHHVAPPPRTGISRWTGPGLYVIGPTQTGLVAIEAQNARSLPWKRTSGVCCA